MNGRKHLTLRITKKKIDGYNYILPSTTKYVAHNNLKLTQGKLDAISLKIPAGIKEVEIEALNGNTFNIWYEASK